MQGMCCTSSTPILFHAFPVSLYCLYLINQNAKSKQKHTNKTMLLLLHVNLFFPLNTKYSFPTLPSQRSLKGHTNVALVNLNCQEFVISFYNAMGSFYVPSTFKQCVCKEKQNWQYNVCAGQSKSFARSNPTD